MKRDMDKVRECLLAIEANPDALFTAGDIIEIVSPDDTEQGVAYFHLLESAKYIEPTDQRGVYRMSWSGHEFMDDTRDPEIWRKTKEGASSVGAWSVTLLGELAKGYIRQKAAALGLPI